MKYIESQTRNTRLSIDTITSSFERFDISGYRQMKDSLRKTGSIHDVKQRIGKIISFDGVVEYDNDGHLIKEIEEKFHQYIVNIRLDTNFTFSKIYNDNGALISKGIGSWLGFSVGKQYLFSENGSLEKVIDHENGYDYPFEKVLAFCKAHHIKLTKGTGQYSVSIRRSKYGRKTNSASQLKPVWAISIPNYKKRGYQIFFLDAKTGAFLSKAVFPFPGEIDMK
ncbi:hypothetical protein INP83_10280 [Mucilaginibacter sp. 21P]|uniref:hypothetical protein n=1 Tax=Mucilaginibacter sp. 21P TaxID=2778902 RepID=UPI001C5669E0|nr:hypothetical protein [Mucilaginibacter sp. 21P]QXV67448.1 hypothetical protein INP83_10280 [Mucilaginibacter sp. 21P]